MKVSGTIMALALATVCGASQAYAQEWTGGYISGHIGFSKIAEGDDNVILFDKNLDGDFADTVNTAAGANAFSPGFCIGSTASSLPASGCTVDDDGPDFGGRVGYDKQSGRFVIGGLVELSAPDHIDSVTAFSTTPAFYTFTRELTYVGSLRARVGYGGERVLIYGTGGGARAKIDHSFATSNAVNTFVEDEDDMAWGYQLGGGVDFKFGKLTAGAEYLWTSLMDEDRYTVRSQGPAAATNAFILTNPAGTDFRRADAFEFGAVRFTMGYRF